MTKSHTAFSFALVTFTVVSNILPLHADNAVPVLLWGGSTDSDPTTSPPVNPFLKTSREEFHSFLRKKLDDSPPVILYVKDNLCVEDFMKHKQVSGFQQPSKGHHFIFTCTTGVNRSLIPELCNTTLFNILASSGNRSQRFVVLLSRGRESGKYHRRFSFV